MTNTFKEFQVQLVTCFFSTLRVLLNDLINGIFHTYTFFLNVRWTEALFFFFLPLQETQYSIVVEDTNAWLKTMSYGLTRRSSEGRCERLWWLKRILALVPTWRIFKVEWNLSIPCQPLFKTQKQVRWDNFSSFSTLVNIGGACP